MSEKYLQNDHWRAILIIQKITNGVTTKYVYGLGLIGEEKCGDFKTYHFDYRGSTAAITDSCGNVTDTFEYDTYGNLTGRTGNSFVIFGYNGRDGVVTDKNGLIYMRARYYNPLMHRFINADVVPGEISDAVTLNRYAYANGNPVSNTDPFGLSAEERGTTLVYGDKEYEIEYPNMEKGTFIEAVWNLDETISLQISKFNWWKFFAMAELEDYGSKNATFNAVAGLTGIISSANNSIEKTFITVRLYSQDSGKRKASIAISTDQSGEKYRMIYGFSGSLEFSGTVERILGKNVDSGLYRVYISLNEAHLKNDAVGYIWFDGDKMMNKPYILPGDAICAKKLFSLDSVKYETSFSKESHEVDASLSKAILERLKDNNITIK